MKVFLSSPKPPRGIYMSTHKPEKKEVGNEIHWAYYKMPIAVSKEYLLETFPNLTEEDIPGPGEYKEVHPVRPAGEPGTTNAYLKEMFEG